ncbi:unnamed protein product [Pieris brassicae]|uniref:Uncharacterized protein n=1 Tax=Pieris brassicae TaxID=7116 RepID=A0A9P0TRZ5_PIEBR|nr:unnamed protein product [Pieris brassicae]
MTESVCYVITSQLFSHQCAPAHLRSSSCAFGGVRPSRSARALERDDGTRDKWGASVDRGQRAALTLTLPLSPLPRTASSYARLLIYDTIRARSSRFPTNNN